MFLNQSFQRVLMAVLFSVSILDVADAYTWKDWNAAKTPLEGRRIEDYYDFGAYYWTEQPYHRLEFDLENEASDAWLVFYSYCSVPSPHKIYINSDLVYEYPEASGKYDASQLIIVPVSGLKKGKNVLWAETTWSSLKLIVNDIHGAQTVLATSPEWQSSSVKGKGWDAPDYHGVSEETQYRLGDEGYHCNIIKFMRHPYVGIIGLQKDRGAPIYPAGARVQWMVSIPSIFYGVEHPALEYAVERCFEDGMESLNGKAKFLTTQDGKDTYEVSFTPPATGAYDVTLSFGDKPAMKRKEELVVTGRVEQPVVNNAKDLINSLNLTKVDEVDCVNLGDKAHELVQGHFENKPPVGKVVTNKGMTYFETGSATGFLVGPERTEYAMWKLAAKDLNEWHLVEIDIPDDKDRVQMVALVHNIVTREYGAESTIELGNPRPSTDRIYTHRMLFIPKFHDVRVMVAPAPATRNAPNPAAVKAIRMYKINGTLPAVRLGGSGRISATYNERSNLVAISHYPGSDGINRFSSAQTFAPCQYRRWYLAIKKHVEYLRFCGHNAVCHGMYQYVKEGYPTGKGETDYISIMLDMYHANGIAFYGNVEYTTSSQLEGKTELGHKVSATKVTDEEIAAGKDTCRMVSSEGKQAVDFSPFNSPCHPDLRRDILRLVSDIGKRYGGHPGFKGLMFFAGTMGCALDFGSPEWGFEDVAYNLFRSSSRKDAPDFKGPKRFSNRSKWISKNSPAEWEKFRCEQVHLLFKSIAVELKKYSPQSKLLVNACAWPWRGNIGGGSVEELDQRLLGAGTDVNLYLDDPNVLMMHNDWQGEHVVQEDLPLVERYNSDRKIWDYVTHGKPCAVFFWTGYYEMTLFFPREMSNPSWYDASINNSFEGVNIEKRFIGSAGKAGRNYLSAYTTAFADANPVFFANRFTDVAEHRGFLEQRAEAGQAMSFIPMGDYEIQPGSTERCVLKRSGNNAYIANNSPQAVQATIVATAAESSQPTVKDCIADKLVSLARPGGAPSPNAAHYFFEMEIMPYQTLPLNFAGVETMKIQLK